MVIILYRPYLRTRDLELQGYAHNACVSRSIIINDCFILYGRSFRHRIMTYLVSYCVYVSSLISVYEIKSPNCQYPQEAAARLSVSLKVLETEAQQTPGIRRSIDILKVQLSTLQGVVPHSNSNNTAAGQMTQSYDNEVKVATSPAISGVSSGTSVGNAPQYPAQLQQADSLDWEAFNTGAGFMPDAYAWNVDDTWTHTSDLDGIYPASIGSAPDLAMLEQQQSNLSQ